MAEAEHIALVRTYTDETTDEHWDDTALGALIDELGIEGATARVWRAKQARYSRLVDVSEAGAARKMSQAFEHAKEMAARWDAIVADTGTAPGRHATVSKIVRS